MYSNEDYLVELLQESGLIGEREIAQAQAAQKQGESLIKWRRPWLSIPAWNMSTFTDTRLIQA